MASPWVTPDLLQGLAGPATTPAVPLWVATVVAAALGMALGSFLNVVVYRTPRRLSVVRPPSFCPACGAPIRAFDNVPVVSWLALRGHCRACKAPISARYPLVEVGTGGLFALVTLAVGPHWAAVGICLLGAALAASAVIELDGEHSPAVVPAVGSALGLAALVAAGGVEHHWAHLLGAAAGLVVAAAVAAWWLRRHGVEGGRGDRAERLWVLLPAGVVLGWTGLVGAVAGIAALCAFGLLLGRRTPSAQRPDSGSEMSGAAESATRRAGPAVAVAVAGVVAVAAALAAGAALS